MNSNIPFEVSGHIVDVVRKRIIDGIIRVEAGTIISITETNEVEDQYICPGFIDAHVHIESSMMVPSEFARIAVRHGSVASVSDPHEIANVCGVDGINYMIGNADTVPFKFFFGAPSCVPATTFETSGSVIDSSGISHLMKRKDIWYLAEMMNYPGVIYEDKEVMKKIEEAHASGKPVDGHAPGVSGKDLQKYVSAGISTDHECSTLEEGREKARLGMNILIREGSAAKDFESLIDLVKECPDKLMFCSDDKHPDDLLVDHINQMAKRAIAKGYDPLTILRICTYNPVKHYKLPVGLLQPGNSADFIILDNLTELNVKATYINGQKVAENGKELFSTPSAYETINRFNTKDLFPQELAVKAGGSKIKVITIKDGELLTHVTLSRPKIENGNVVADIQEDILKIVVYNRYNTATPQIGFIKNFGLKQGAIASTIAHDSHNIVAVGCSDEDIAKAINLLVEQKGGISACSGDEHFVLPLCIAGLIYNGKAEDVAEGYQKANDIVKKYGSPLTAPYMTLSFMALLVIPELKLSDKGLFDGNKFEMTSLFDA